MFVEKRPQRRFDLVGQQGVRLRAREHGLHLGRRLGPVNPGPVGRIGINGGRVFLEIDPEDLRQTTAGRVKTQQVRPVQRWYQRFKKQCCIVVVNASLVTFLVTRSGKIAGNTVDLGFIAQRATQGFQTEGVTLSLGRGENQRGKILAPIHLRAFRIQRHVPVRTRIDQVGMVNLLVKLGPGEVQKQCITARDDGQIQLLGVDTEPVSRPQLDDIAARLEHIGLGREASARLAP